MRMVSFFLSTGRSGLCPSSRGNFSYRHRVFQISTTCSAAKPKNKPRRGGHDSKKSQTATLEEPCVSESETRLSVYLNRIQRCKALVVDTSYKPIDVINWEKAICLDYRNKVDVLEYYEECVHSARDVFPIPAVLRVRMFLSSKKGCQGPSLCRRNVLIRDNGECQYCGSRSDLTLDHVIPSSLGGKFTWDNLVTACGRCNVKKGAKTLQQMGWKLKKQPKEPTAYELGVLLGTETSLHEPPKEWSDYLIGFHRAGLRRDDSWEEVGSVEMI